MIGRALLLACALALPLTSAAQTGLLRGSQTTRGEAAVSALQDSTGLTGGPDITVDYHLLGGFQDLFVLARLRSNPDGLDALLAQLGTTPDSLGATAPLAAIGTVPWWEPASLPGLRGGPVTLPGFAAAWIGFAPDPQDPAGFLIYLRAVQS